MEISFPRTGAGAGGGSPGRAPELLVKLDLLRCLIAAECAVLEVASLPCPSPRHSQGSCKASSPLCPRLQSLFAGNKELLAQGGCWGSIPGAKIGVSLMHPEKSPHGVPWSKQGREPQLGH